MYGYDESKADLSAMSKWYGFPVEKDIASRTYETEAGGRKLQATATADRWFTLSDKYKGTKSTAHKGLPLYRFTLSIPEIGYTSTAEIQQKERWGTYDEKARLEPFFEQYAKLLADPESKTSKAVKTFEDASRRPQEFKEYLDALAAGDRTFTLPFTIQEGEYAGTYEFKSDTLSLDEHRSALRLQLVPPSADAPRTYGTTLKIPLYGVHSEDALAEKAAAYAGQYEKEISGILVKYLSSFPFLESQKKATAAEAREVGNMLEPPYPVDQIILKLAERGYIYKTKKQKQGEGLSGNDTRWIVDSKKATADAYASGYSSRTPNFFYAVVAYAVHRKIKGIASFSEMALVDAVSKWADAMSMALNHKIDIRNALDAVDKIAGDIVLKIWPKKTREQKEREFRDWFYGSDHGGQNRGDKPGKTGTPAGLEAFKEFAATYGIDPATVEASPKKAYYELAKMLHPDMDEETSSEEAFKQLQNIWDGVPSILKSASDWFDRHITASISQDRPARTPS
jgi:hypothetical protein